jgi:hypothetical protein
MSNAGRFKAMVAKMKKKGAPKSTKGTAAKTEGKKSGEKRMRSWAMKARKKG